MASRFGSRHCIWAISARTHGWIVETLANGVDKCREWGRYVGQRYKDYSNIVWIMGADRNPNEAMNHVNAMAEGIKENGTSNLFTAHVHPECCAMEQYALGGWLDINCTYSYEIVHRRLKEDYARRPIKPYVLMESIYEGEYNASALQIRRQAYWTVLCGACGGFFGNKPLWGFYPGWQEAMESDRVAGYGAGAAALPVATLAHARAGAGGRTEAELIVSGYGEIRGLDFATAARTSDGKTIIAYLPSRRTITVDMSKIVADSVENLVVQPAHGRAVAAGEAPASGLRGLTTPGDGDWVLVLLSAALGLPPPGAIAGE